MISSFGGMGLEISIDKIRTFRDLQIQIQKSVKYSEQAIHGHNRVLVFTGLSLASMSFSIRLNAGV